MDAKHHRGGESFKARIACEMIRHEDPDTLMALIDAVLPAVVDALPKDDLKILIERLFETHMPTLLHDLDHAERVELLRKVLPAIEREFPLADVDLRAK